MNEDKLIKFEKLYEDIFEEYQENEDKEAKLIKKAVLISTFIGISMCLGNLIISTLSLFIDSFQSVLSYLLTPFYNNTAVSQNVAYKLFCIIISTYATSSATMYITHYFNYCLITIRLLKHFSKKFKILVQKNEISLKNKNSLVGELAFEELTNWYLKLTTLVQCLNVCFQKFIASALLCCITGSFLLIWIITTWSPTCITGLLVFIIPFWLVTVVIILLVIILSAVEINLQVN